MPRVPSSDPVGRKGSLPSHGVRRRNPGHPTAKDQEHPGDVATVSKVRRTEQSDAGPKAPFDGQGEGFGPLAADQEPGAVGQVEPDAAVAAGVEHALAVAARADAPAAVVGERPVADDLERGRSCRSATTRR